MGGATRAAYSGVNERLMSRTPQAGNGLNRSGGLLSIPLCILCATTRLRDLLIMEVDGRYVFLCLSEAGPGSQGEARSPKEGRENGGGARSRTSSKETKEVRRGPGKSSGRAMPPPLRCRVGQVRGLTIPFMPCAASLGRGFWGGPRRQGFSTGAGHYLLAASTAKARGLLFRYLLTPH